jgi:hypothetical protein
MSVYSVIELERLLAKGWLVVLLGRHMSVEMKTQSKSEQVLWVSVFGIPSIL